MPKQPLGFPVFSWYRRGRLWVAPTTGALVALMADAAALLLDRHVFSPDTAFPKFVDQVETARSLLTVTATSIATLTALVLTIVAIVLELASNSYSHRRFEPCCRIRTRTGRWRCSWGRSPTP